MPNEFSGSQTSEDFAPHMYIGGHFVGNNPITITVSPLGRNIYHRVGVAVIGSEPVVVCERRDEFPLRDGFYEYTTVKTGDVPLIVKEKLAELLSSKKSVNVSPNDQEIIRRAFKLPQ